MDSTATSSYNWADLAQKLGLTTEPVKPHRPSKKRAGSVTAAGSLDALLKQQCVDGERTEHLTRLIGTLLAARIPADEALQMCHAWNEQNVEPLDSGKVDSTFRSIYAIDQRNHPERYPELQVHEPLFDLNAGRIDRYLAAAPKPRRWLLKDLIVLGKVGAIVAPGGSSKSQWLLQLAVGVATGLPVAEHWEIGETGGVLVFCAEDDEDEIHRRLRRITEHFKLTGHIQQMADIEERLYVYSTIGTDTLLTKRDTTGEVSTTSIVHRIAALADQIEDLKLIIIDPASRFRGGEENSNEDATRFVEALETLAKRTGATVLIAHHTNKSSYAADAEPGQGASRGASALTDGLRWQMNLSRPSEKQLGLVGAAKDQASRHVAATVTKTNYSAFPAPVILERLDNGYLTAITPMQSQQRADNAAILNVLGILMQQSKPITARLLEERFGGVSGSLKLPKHDVRRIVQLAIARGFLAGGERKPLTVTAMGTSIATSTTAAATEVASKLSEKTAREKT
ncbi:AAA family ATPase [Ottowia caeni]|uniref:AAA family ATPase n=1 Tax=Ottowia caeni TaxID=2870339 RepID=UPI001E57BBDF|nr:AAA family ATPase [Ottowia caeni]